MDDYRILYSSQIYLHYLASQFRIQFALQIYTGWLEIGGTSGKVQVENIE